MKYRKFGKTNEMVSVLGFGMMRLPLNSDDNKDINEELAVEMVRKSIDEGLNYIDTAYVYHDGESEAFTAKVLKDGYREKVFLATKLPTWLVKTEEDLDKYLDEQLANLETDCIDFYLIHALNKNSWKNVLECGLLKFLDKIKIDKRVKHVGFSFHDEYDLFEEIVDQYDWDFCQIMLNYVDVNYQAGLKGYEYAKKKNLGIVIMEPLRGGGIVNNVHDEILDVFKKENENKSVVEWAFDYLYDFENIHVLLSGMSEMSHVVDNLKIADKSEVNKLSKTEKQALETAGEIYRSKLKVNCTGCRYCMPCPHGVSIARCFDVYNDAHMFNSIQASRGEYWSDYGKGTTAELCLECNECMSKCPQNIDIISELKNVVNTFGDKK